MINWCRSNFSAFKLLYKMRILKGFLLECKFSFGIFCQSHQLFMYFIWIYGYIIGIICNELSSCYFSLTILIVELGYYTVFYEVLCCFSKHLMDTSFTLKYNHRLFYLPHNQHLLPLLFCTILKVITILKNNHLTVRLRQLLLFDDASFQTEQLETSSKCELY